jgi:membrane associated rhomboid family serine protease
MLDRILALLGTNRTRMEWKLRAWRRAWERQKARIANRTQTLSYQHQTCPECSHPAGADENVCTRCGHALGGRLAHRARRVFGLLWERGTPVAATVLTGAIAAMYLASSMWGPNHGLGGIGLAPHPLAFERFGAASTVAIQDGEWWRMSTATFLHVNLLHLAFNLTSLWTAAIFLEEVIGAKKTLVLYLALGLAASLVSFVWHTQTPPYVGSSVGASGAVCGLIGVALGFTLRRRNAARHVLRNYVVWGVWILVIGFSGWRIDNAAHAGGLVGGFLAGLVVRRRGVTVPLVARAWTFALVAVVAVTISSLVAASQHQVPDEWIEAARADD